MIKELQNVALADLVAPEQNNTKMEKFYTTIEIYKDRVIVIDGTGKSTMYKGEDIFHEVSEDTNSIDIIVDGDIEFSSPAWCTFVYYKNDDKYQW